MKKKGRLSLLLIGLWLIPMPIWYFLGLSKFDLLGDIVLTSEVLLGSAGLVLAVDVWVVPWIDQSSLPEDQQ